MSAGDVGVGNPGAPGYAGYIPSWTKPIIQTGCGPNARVPLEERNNTTSTAPTKRLDTSMPSIGDTLPSHESYLLQKRGTGAKTVYASDTANIGLDTFKNSSGKAKSPSGAKLPESRAFNAVSSNSVSSAAMQEKSEDPAYFSKLVKKSQQPRPKEDDFSHTNERNANAAKGKGGAVGLDCLSGSAASHGALPQDLRPQFQMKSIPRRDLCKGELKAATDTVKLMGHMSQPTSYGVEFGNKGDNPRARMARRPQDFAAAASTADLFAGTAKSTGLRIPGYMGHVPASTRNISKMKGDKDKVVGASQTSIMLNSSVNLPGYSGHKPHSIHNDTGRATCPDPDLTTSGACAKYVANDSVEKGMNSREHAKSHELKKFFSQGSGEDSGQVADQFFQKFRPLEGYMSHGSKHEQSWITDTQLRRSYITSTTG